MSNEETKTFTPSELPQDFHFMKRAQIAKDLGTTLFESQTPQFKNNPHFIVSTHNGGFHIENGETLQGLRDQGLSDNEIGDRLDEEAKEAQRKRNEKFAELARANPDMYETEDPLAGDVDPTGVYFQEPPNPYDAHREAVARQHGD